MGKIIRNEDSCNQLRIEMANSNIRTYRKNLCLQRGLAILHTCFIHRAKLNDLLPRD